ncbi:MAG: hypothetical protein PHU45_02740 [Bacilli bacterium]|nr:hypothetical protein [Bacilli bacterium]
MIKLSQRQTEIIKMILNESEDRKNKFIFELKTNKLPEKYLRKLEKEERNLTRVLSEIKFYFEDSD